ncbi:MAG: Sigma-70 region 2 [Chitinophagaceae bacterium]|nr:Sigma-70 region 2 [Chitinophagaceae bacterium]
MLKEEEIIKGCKKFEASSQQVLYNLYRQKMYGVCLRYITDKDEAKDILQDGFIKIFTQFKQYKGEGSLEGWLRRVMVNTALMHLRKKKRLLFTPLSEDNSDFNDNETEEEHLSIADIDFTEEELLECINLLPHDFRIVFNLFCIEDYSHKEIADMLLINENTSRSRLSRARIVLQNHLIKMAAEKEKTKNIKTYKSSW